MSDHFGDDERGRLSERRDAHLPALMPTGPHFVGPPCDPPPIHSEDAAAVDPPPLPEWRDLPDRVAALEREVARAEESSQSGLRITLELTGQNAGALWLDAIPRLVADYGGVPRASVRVAPSAEADAEADRLKCDECSRSFSFDDFNGGTRRLVEPDNAFGPERWETLCPACVCKDAIRERDAALARVGELEKQLPDGMERCTITFHECGKGHGWLSATNWVQHPCQHCERDALKARVAELEAQQAQQADAEPVAEFTIRVDDSAVRAAQSGMDVGALRRPPPRGWLTEEERKLLRDVHLSFVNKSTAAFNANRSAAARQYADEADIIHALLSRNSPPRVWRVAPWEAKDARSEPFTEELLARRDLEWIAAIAKAGVEMAE